MTALSQLYFYRVNACIRYGWNKVGDTEDMLGGPLDDHNLLKYPENGWSQLVSASTSDSCPNFNMRHIVAYFVTRTE